MRHDGRSIRGSDKQTMTLVIATADVGRIIGKYNVPVHVHVHTCTPSHTNVNK